MNTKSELMSPRFYLPTAKDDQRDSPVGSLRCTLKKKMPAIQTAGDPEPRLGLFVELPRGAEIEIIGPGFTEAMVKIRWHEHLYFVFRQDIGQKEDVR